jgi:predicted NBD/HSP70 family sugar kinase
MSMVIGLDIGGTKLMVAAADESGRERKRVKSPTPDDLEEGLQRLHDMIKEVSAGERITSIGAAIGGPLDWQTGVVSPLHQPGWRQVPLKDIFETQYGCPFFVDVDTNVAALGEWTFGGEKSARFLYMTVSTGIGGGFLVDGQIYRGKDGAHPEIGHQSIPYHSAHPERIRCECGAPDCLEALVSGNGIRRLYGKPAQDLTAGEWDEVSTHLAQGLRNLTAILCPDVIVLGGGVAVGGGEPLIKNVERKLVRSLFIVPPPRVRLSHLGYDTALKGTLALAVRGISS